MQTLHGRRKSLLSTKEANKYVERSIREFFSIIAAPIVGQTYNLSFTAKPEQFNKLKTTLSHAFKQEHILQPNQYHFEYDGEDKNDNVSYSGHIELHIGNKKYTREELQNKIVNHAYEVVDQNNLYNR